jgi:hypothetical protein
VANYSLHATNQLFMLPGSEADEAGIGKRGAAGSAKIRDIAYRYGIDSESVSYRRIESGIDSPLL